MAKIAAAHKRWAEHLRSVVPGKAAVTRHWDEDNTHHVDIFSSLPDEGVVAATIGLMDYDQSRNPNIHAYTEVLMDAREGNSVIGNVLCTIGLFIIKDGWKAAPGVVFETMVEMYLPQSELKHVLFVPPFQWKDGGMSRVDLGVKTVHPLLAVPITDGERDLVFSQGAKALEDRWEQANCDVLDWKRTGLAVKLH